MYVDNDPLVLALSQGLLTSTPEGRTSYVEADMRDPRAILDSPAVRDTLDLGEPVALTVVAIVHFLLDFLLDEHDAVGLVQIQVQVQVQVQVHRWRPDGTDGETIRDADIARYGVVAPKP